MRLVGAVQPVQPFHALHNAPRFMLDQAVVQRGDVGLEVTRRQGVPAAPFRLQHFAECFGVVRQRFIAQIFSKPGVGGSVEKLPRGLLPVPVGIGQAHHIGGNGLFLDALVVLRVVQLKEIAPDFPALHACKLNGIGQNPVAGLLLMETPGIVRPCVL